MLWKIRFIKDYISGFRWLLTLGYNPIHLIRLSFEKWARVAIASPNADLYIMEV